MENKVYRLKHPKEIAVFGQQDGPLKIDHIKLRRATGADMLLIDDHQHQPMRLVLKMIAALSDQPDYVIEALDAEDVGPLGELAFANVEGGPKTGGIV